MRGAGGVGGWALCCLLPRGTRQPGSTGGLWIRAHLTGGLWIRAHLTGGLWIRAHLTGGLWILLMSLCLVTHLVCF